MADLCLSHEKHDQYLPARTLDGPTACVWDYPLRRQGSSLYWDYPATGGMVSFDDADRVATEYAEVDDETGVERAYTAEESERADWLTAQVTINEAAADLNRATALNAAPEELAALQEAILAGEGLGEGDPWRQPTGAHDAYPLGALVTHIEKLWESLVAANVWEPPISWREVTAGGCPEFVQPTGGHDAYNTGDCVTFEGKCYESTMDANVWTPIALPSGWKEIDCP
jgi:hypothetical protein